MPATIANLSKSILYKPVRVEVAPVSSVVDTIKQNLYFVEKPQKSKLLIDILEKGKEKDRFSLFKNQTRGRSDCPRIKQKGHRL